MTSVEKFSSFLDWKTIIVDSYKDLGLDEIDLAIVLIIDRYKSEGQSLVTPELIALKHTQPCEVIDSHLSNLMSKGYIVISDTKAGLETSIRPLIDKVILNVIVSTEKENGHINDEIYSLLEQSLSRPLTQFEISVVRSWFENGEKIEQIKEAINVANFSNKKNINYINSVLLEWKRRNDIAESGDSVITNKWRKNINETIEIANLNWLEDEQ